MFDSIRPKGIINPRNNGRTIRHREITLAALNFKRLSGVFRGGRLKKIDANTYLWEVEGEPPVFYHVRG